MDRNFGAHVGGTLFKTFLVVAAIAAAVGGGAVALVQWLF